MHLALVAHFELSTHCIRTSINSAVATALAEATATMKLGKFAAVYVVRAAKALPIGMYRSYASSGCTLPNESRSRSDEDWRALFDTLYENQPNSDTVEARAVVPLVPIAPGAQVVHAARIDEGVPGSSPRP